MVCDTSILVMGSVTVGVTGDITVMGFGWTYHGTLTLFASTNFTPALPNIIKIISINKHYHEA